MLNSRCWKSAWMKPWVTSLSYWWLRAIAGGHRISRSSRRGLLNAIHDTRTVTATIAMVSEKPIRSASRRFQAQADGLASQRLDLGAMRLVRLGDLGIHPGVRIADLVPQQARIALHRSQAVEHGLLRPDLVDAFLDEPIACCRQPGCIRAAII